MIMDRECWGLQFTQEWLNSFKESAALGPLFKAMSFGVDLGQFTPEEHEDFANIVGTNSLKSMAPSSISWLRSPSEKSSKPFLQQAHTAM